jgi:hypothetical protein
METPSFEQISDDLIGPILKSQSPQERKKLLELLRKLTPSGSSAHAWIDQQLGHLI